MIIIKSKYIGMTIKLKIKNKIDIPVYKKDQKQ